MLVKKVGIATGPFASTAAIQSASNFPSQSSRKPSNYIIYIVQEWSACITQRGNTGEDMLLLLVSHGEVMLLFIVPQDGS